MDLDWFVFDASGTLIHFTSAGGYLPAFIKDEAFKIDAKTLALDAKILALPEISNQIIISPNLYKAASIANEQEFSLYIVSYEEHARRGLYTYDKTSPYYAGSTYHLVACPIISLKYEDVPSEFRDEIPFLSNLLMLDSTPPFEIVTEELVIKH
ncbi:hypothetical protein GCM10028824_07780 [Hymenobacter segetis]|uniref:RES domain-containing protein n=1 Tax=Hymenobacter segetis TaxID=2025509 RepID=A0ABU9LTE7_9BACT